MQVSSSKTRLGALRARKSTFSMLKDRTLFLVLIIGLSPNCVQFYIPEDNYKKKQCDTFNDHGNREFLLIIMAVAMASAATCVWQS